MITSHSVEPWIDGDVLYLKFTCQAIPGDPCLMHHVDPFVESWSADDPDLVPSDSCNALDWLEELGPEAYSGSTRILTAGPIVVRWADGVEWWYPDDPKFTTP